MRMKNRLLHLFMALVMLLTYLTVPTALADDTVTVTLNVTNTPVRGDVVLEKKGLQLVRFQNETDANGYSVMKPVYENGYLAGAKFELHAKRSEDRNADDYKYRLREIQSASAGQVLPGGSFRAGWLCVQH